MNVAEICMSVCYTLYTCNGKAFLWIVNNGNQWNTDDGKRIDY